MQGEAQDAQRNWLTFMAETATPHHEKLLRSKLLNINWSIARCFTLNKRLATTLRDQNPPVQIGKVISDHILGAHRLQTHRSGPFCTDGLSHNCPIGVQIRPLTGRFSLLGPSARQAGGFTREIRVKPHACKIWLIQPTWSATVETVGLFEAKTHLSEYVARAEAGEEVIITRHHKPVAKIVPFVDQSEPALAVVPKFVQRTFNMGVPLVDLTQAGKLAGELDDQGFIGLTARLAHQAKP